MTNKSLFTCILLLFALLTGPASTAYAQFETASVVGTVRDQSGAVVPDAKVTLTNTANRRRRQPRTDENGTYEFVTVRVGLYLVTAENQGFSIALADNVQVQVGARLRVDLQMAVGQLSEKVDVTGASPLHRDRLEPAQPGDHRRADARARRSTAASTRRWRC